MIENLYRLIDDEKIALIEDDLTSMNLDGLYFDNVIVLHKNLKTNAERKCILAEEIGHHMTTTDNILDQGKLHNEKQEEAARRWATKEMIKIEDLINAFNKGICNRWELSQFLDVTESFIDESLIYFMKLYGEKLTINEYTIFFDPLWIYKSFE